MKAELAIALCFVGFIALIFFAAEVLPKICFYIKYGKMPPTTKELKKLVQSFGEAKDRIVHLLNTVG